MYVHLILLFLSLRAKFWKLLSLFSKKHGSLSLSSPNLQNTFPSSIELMIWYPHELGTSRSMDLVWISTLTSSKKESRSKGLVVEMWIDEAQACNGIRTYHVSSLESSSSLWVWTCVWESMVLLVCECRNLVPLMSLNCRNLMSQ